MSVYLIQDFDEHMEREVLPELTAHLHKKAEEGKGEVTLFINSHGGMVHLAWHLITLIEHAKESGVLVRTIVTHAAYSAGSLVAVAGTKGERYIASRAEHLAHYGSQESTETTPRQVARAMAEKLRGFSRIRKHYLSNTEIPEEALDRLLEDDNGYLPADLALMYGLADKTY